MKSDRSRIALAERTIGGLKIDISSEVGTELGTFSSLACVSVPELPPSQMTDLHCFCSCWDVSCARKTLGHRDEIYLYKAMCAKARLRFYFVDVISAFLSYISRHHPPSTFHFVDDIEIEDVESYEEKNN